MKFPISDLRIPISDLRHKAGMALVVTLSLIVLVTIAAMAFFARATSNRIIEASRSNQILVSQLAQTATDYASGQFLQEIAANSTNSQPNNPTNTVPQRRLAPGSTGPVFANLVRQSASNADPNASSDNTASPSMNGRWIGTNAWNAPMLTVNGGFSSINQLPNWIYVNRDGSVTNAASTNAVGRFAYNVYDLGGLLDANVAGYPSSVTGTNLSAIKGMLAGADLANALGISQAAIDALVAFRNPQASTAAAYTNFVQGAAKSGFLSTIVTNGSGSGVTTNNFFCSRQDLIRYAKTQNAALTNALPFLTHFTREANAPSWSPTTNATGAAYQYKANADASTSTNCNIPNVRVSSGFKRLDGTDAPVGEPVVKNRFPLSRLGWLQDGDLGTGAFDPTTQTASDLSLINAARARNSQPALTVAQAIQQAFGLVWNPSNYRWDYCGPTGSTMQSGILTLNTVAAAGREPNFFELLKAGILNGSLGLAMPGSGLTTAAVQNSPDFQIFRIGASAVDQVKSDSYPTRIAYNVLGLPWVACGIQRLPYVSRWTQVPIRNTAATSTNSLTLDDYKFSIVIVPVLFNPFQGPDLLTTNDSKLLPLPTQRPNVRVTIQGTCRIMDGWSDTTAPVVIPSSSLAMSTNGRDSMGSFGQDSYITTADAVSVPTSGSGPYMGDAWEQFMTNADWSTSARGMPVGFRLAPRSPFNNDTNKPPYLIVWYGGDVVATPKPFQLSMEFLAPNGNWYPYSMASGVEGDDSTWPVKLYAHPTDLRSPDGPKYETVPAPWVNMVPYSYDGAGLEGRAGATNYAYSDFDFVANFCQVVVKIDPRSIRFNTVGANNLNLQALSGGGRLTKGLWNMPPLDYRNDVTNYVNYQSPGPRAWSQADAGFALNEISPDTTYTPPILRPSLVFPPGLIKFFPALLCRNSGSNESACGGSGAANASYNDPDGVQRIADCGLYPTPAFNSSGYTSATPTTGNPFLPGSPVIGNNPDRPIVLNRPFRSVAELGYVFRDQPFKTLDFFSDKSADAALLDLFCVSENTAGLRAGVINLNSQNAAAMASLLSGAATREQEASQPTLGASGAGTIASNLTAATASAPLQNKAALAAFISTQTNSLGSGKAGLETIARTLADVGQTRTWNLLSHVVAQSGRWTPQGGFIVEGQKTVWNSLAIDRPQAKIIDQQIENVTDY